MQIKDLLIFGTKGKTTNHTGFLPASFLLVITAAGLLSGTLT